MNYQEASEQIWESLQHLTVATMLSLSKDSGTDHLWYDFIDGCFFISDFDTMFQSPEEALEWYSENIDSVFSIDIKEL